MLHFLRRQGRGQHADVFGLEDLLVMQDERFVQFDELLHALQAVLATAERRSFHKLLVAGDIAFPGPEPVETWKRLNAAGAVIVQGVSDRAVATLDPDALRPTSELESSRLQRMREVRDALGELVLRRLAKLPTHFRMPLADGGELLLVHGSPRDPTEAMTAGVADPLRLGCSANGFTIYPGSAHQFEMYQQIRTLGEEAKRHGLAVVVWSYPRGSAISKEGETAIDVVGYAAQIAAQLGTHIIKVKLPTAYLEQEAAKKVYLEKQIPIATQAERVRHIVQCAFDGRRIVIFSGGAAVFDDEKLMAEFWISDTFILYLCSSAKISEMFSSMMNEKSIDESEISSWLFLTMKHGNCGSRSAPLDTLVPGNSGFTNDFT